MDPSAPNRMTNKCKIGLTIQAIGLDIHSCPRCMGRAFCLERVGSGVPQPTPTDRAQEMLLLLVPGGEEHGRYCTRASSSMSFPTAPQALN